MGLLYQPKVGDVFMCDFNGFQAPEMVKKRPVIVISKNRNNAKLVTIVPLSTTQPTKIEDYHYELPNNPVPNNAHVKCWAKCDMLATVSISRMDRLKGTKKRERVVPVIEKDEMAHIRECVGNALNLKSLL